MINLNDLITKELPYFFWKQADGIYLPLKMVSINNRKIKFNTSAKTSKEISGFLLSKEGIGFYHLKGKIENKKGQQFLTINMGDILYESRPEFFRETPSPEKMTQRVTLCKSSRKEKRVVDLIDLSADSFRIQTTLNLTPGEQYKLELLTNPNGNANLLSFDTCVISNLEKLHPNVKDFKSSYGLWITPASLSTPRELISFTKNKSRLREFAKKFRQFQDLTKKFHNHPHSIADSLEEITKNLI